MIPRLAVIIPSFNTRELLRACLRSVLESGVGADLSILVVDNGSADGTREMLASEYPAVHTVLNTENRRWAGANNQGIQLTDAPYLLLLNSDTLIHGDAIPAMVEFLQANPDVAAIGPKLLNADGSLQRSCRSLPNPVNVFSEAFFLYKMFPRTSPFGNYHMTNFDHMSSRKVEMVTGAAIMIRREAIRDIGYFDENFYFYGEETDYFKRAATAGKKTVFFPHATITHHGSASPQARYNYFLNQHRGIIAYFLKHHHGPSLLSMMTFKYAGNVVRSPLYLIGGLLSADKDMLKKSWYYLRVLFG